MKRSSKLMRASGVLLVLTLATSCFVGRTFAKYISQAEATDTARVAKWGVKVTATAGSTFGRTYAKHDMSPDTGLESISNTVESSDTANVFAPGTQGKFGGITIAGTPEVAVKVTTEATVDLGYDADPEAWKVNGRAYCPLLFKIGNEVIDGLAYDGTTGATIGDLEAAIEAAIEETTLGTDNGYYAANIDLQKAIDYEWAWLFTNEDAGKFWNDGTPITRDISSYEQSNIDDTALGNLAADGDAPDISITVKTIVTQVD